MVDHVSPTKRSEIMRSVKQTGSSAEMIVRKLVWSLGFRYRLNVKSLPGSPDLVFGGRRKVIFVHGCFWHGHRECAKARLPKSNSDFWAAKIASNMKRDESVRLRLNSDGWSVLTVWQCELRDRDALSEKLRNFLDSP